MTIELYLYLYSGTTVTNGLILGAQEATVYAAMLTSRKPSTLWYVFGIVLLDYDTVRIWQKPAPAPLQCCAGRQAAEEFRRTVRRDVADQG